jgi:hypothetical protein
MQVKVRRAQQKKLRAIHNDRALLFTPGPPRKSNDEYAAEREGSLTAFYGNDAIKALVSSSVSNIERASRLMVSPLTADHRRWQIEVVTAKVLRHDGMIMTRGKHCQVWLPDLSVLILLKMCLSSGWEPGGQ